MLLLTATTDKIQITTSAAVTVDVHASYMDYNGTTVTPGRQNTAITTATTTDVVASPGASTQRNIKTLHVRNKHASSNTDVTVIYDQNSTDYELHKVTLRAGEMLEYIEGVGFFTVTTTTPSGLTIKSLASDFTSTSTTAAEVSGLTVTADTGAYYFRYALIYQTAATTTGLKLSCNHSGTVSEFIYTWQFVDAVATGATGAADADFATATATVFSVYAARVKSTTGIVASVSVDTANADMFTIIEGNCVVTATGSLQLYAATEVGASQLTIKDGSNLLLIKAS